MNAARRRVLVAGFSLVFGLGACGNRSGSGGVRTDGAGDCGTDAKVLCAETASFETIAARPQRIMVGISNKEGLLLQGGTVELRLTPSDADTPVIRATAGYLPVQQPETPPARPRLGRPSRGIGVYAAEGVTMPTSGFWIMHITAKTTDGTKIAETAVQVLDAPRVVDVGQAAPKTVNPVIGSPGVKPEQIDSLGAPFFDAALHHDVIADVLAAKRALVVVVSTPAFCQSRFCGPITTAIDALAASAAKRGSRTAFVHVEVWADYAAQKVSPSALQWIAPDHGEANEPWVFFVARDGKVTQRFDNVATADELTNALAVIDAS